MKRNLLIELVLFPVIAPVAAVLAVWHWMRRTPIRYDCDDPLDHLDQIRRQKATLGKRYGSADIPEHHGSLGDVIWGDQDMKLDISIGED